jgi:hypothetical protein
MSCRPKHRGYELELLEPEHPSLPAPPHPRDPRRRPGLRHLLELEDPPLLELPEADYGRPLRPLPPPEAPTFRPANLPNVRDPRRVRACVGLGYPAWNLGPVTLVESEALLVDEDTCPVLVIDLTDWPRLKRSHLELWPHERNAERAILDLHQSEVSPIEGFDAGGDDPMLDLDAGDSGSPYVECLAAPRKAKQQEADFVDLVDLSDEIVYEVDDEVVPLPTEEKGKKSCRTTANSRPVTEIVILDDDDEDDDEDEVRVLETCRNPFAATAIAHGRLDPQEVDIAASTALWAEERGEGNNSSSFRDARVEAVLAAEDDAAQKGGAEVEGAVSMKRRRRTSRAPPTRRKRDEVKRRRKLAKESRKDTRSGKEMSSVNGGTRDHRHDFRPLVRYIKSCNVTWSCVNYFLNNYRHLPFSQFLQINRQVLADKAFYLHRYCFNSGISFIYSLSPWKRPTLLISFSLAHFHHHPYRLTSCIRKCGINNRPFTVHYIQFPVVLIKITFQTTIIYVCLRTRACGGGGGGLGGGVYAYIEP